MEIIFVISEYNYQSFYISWPAAHLSFIQKILFEFNSKALSFKLMDS